MWRILGSTRRSTPRCLTTPVDHDVASYSWPLLRPRCSPALTPGRRASGSRRSVGWISCTRQKWAAVRLAWSTNNEASEVKAQPASGRGTEHSRTCSRGWRPVVRDVARGRPGRACSRSGGSALVMACPAGVDRELHVVGPRTRHAKCPTDDRAPEASTSM